jgi:hypothetical protein
MPVDVDMIVAPDPAQPPFGIFVGLGRQRLQRRRVELEEEIAPADAEAAHRPRVEIGDQLPDRSVQLGQREEAAVPQPRQNPALDGTEAAPATGRSRDRWAWRAALSP